MRLIDLARGGLLDLGAIRTRPFPLEALPEAMDAAATVGGLECVVVQPS
jgi:alcohol dehydrogenase